MEICGCLTVFPLENSSVLSQMPVSACFSTIYCNQDRLSDYCIHLDSLLFYQEEASLYGLYMHMTVLFGRTGDLCNFQWTEGVQWRICVIYLVASYVDWALEHCHLLDFWQGEWVSYGQSCDRILVWQIYAPIAPASLRRNLVLFYMLLH